MRGRIASIVVFIVALLLSVPRQAYAAQFYKSDRLSSGLITCLCQDSRGFIWIGTEYGLNKFDGYRFTHYLHHPSDTTTIVSNEISILYVDDEGTLWIGTAHGLSRYDESGDCFQRYNFPSDVRPRVTSMITDSRRRLLIGTAGYGLFSLERGSSVVASEDEMNRRPIDMFYSRIFLDKNNSLWRSSHVDTLTRFKPNTAIPEDFYAPYGQAQSFVEYGDSAMLVICQRGIMHYDYRTRQLSDAGIDLSVLGGQQEFVSGIADADGNIYVCTSLNGLLVIRRGGTVLERVDGGVYNRLISSDVNRVIQDSHKNLWVACRGQGLVLLNREADAFQSWNFSDMEQSIDGTVSTIVSDGADGICCAVYPGGIYCFDSHGRLTSHPHAPDGVRSIHRDGQGRYWLGTEDALYRYDLATGSATQIATFSGNGVTCMADDGYAKLFAAVYGRGLYVYDIRTGQGEILSMNDADRPGGTLCNDWIKSLYVDSQGLLWICTTDGVAMMEPDSYIFNRLGWTKLLDGKQCYTVCETSDGRLLISADDGLYRYDRQANRISLLPDADQLHDKRIGFMMRDRHDNIWMSTNMGIWQLTGGDNRIIGHISGNGLSVKEYVAGAGMRVVKNAEGEERLFFGSSEGVVTFYPIDVVADDAPPGNVQLTRLTANGRYVPIERGDVPTYYFSSNEKTVLMEFSLLDYRSAENISFQWRLNVSGEWHSLAQGNNQLVLNELQSGSYLIEVRASNNGLLSRGLYAFRFVIADPWYSTWWAYLIYFLLFVGVIALVLLIILRQQRRDLEETKMRFLINATHDIRSPLTLIMGAVAKLKGERKNIKRATTSTIPVNTVNTLNSSVDTIDRNAQHLLQLVNQILDENKIDKGQMSLHCQLTDMAVFVANNLKLFEYAAQQRNITLSFDHPADEVMAWIDRTEFDKVVSNLLSNALKFTPDGGDISVSLSYDGSQFDDSDHLMLSVIDNGLGFGDENTEHYFDRFYQGKNSRDLHIEGTGIGLNLCRGITELHGGTIAAHNRTDGVTGAVVTVTLPLGSDHLTPEQMEDSSVEMVEIIHDDDDEEPVSGGYADDSTMWTQAGQQSVNAQSSVDGGMPRLLVVDDDSEVGRFIESELAQWYRFEQASNGIVALNMLMSNHFDLVISDVMMPEMDGLTLLRSIKQNAQLSFLPVILLTSKEDVEYRLEGLRKGADGYLAKPFRIEELHVLIDNLLANMRNMGFNTSAAPQQADQFVEVMSNKGELMERVIKSVNDHLSDSDFTIDILVDEVGVGRGQLLRMIKEVTGGSATDFIRNLRMEQAARLLREKKTSLSQVAYQVGFNNLNEFSTTFKKHFGVSPMEYASEDDQPMAEAYEIE